MTATKSEAGNLMALDVGTVRVGVALASGIARLAQPHTTLQQDASLWYNLREVIEQEAVGTIVIGLPRGLDGQETAQTAYCRQFAKDAAEQLGLTVVLQDEALTSSKAEAELRTRKTPHVKEDIDALAAAYILEDYLKEQR